MDRLKGVTSWVRWFKWCLGECSLNLNLWVVPTSLLAIVLFWAGMKFSARAKSVGAVVLLVALSVILAIPWAAFAAYYFIELNGAQWYYRFRAIPSSEMTAALGGILFGFLRVRVKPKRKYLNEFVDRFIPLTFAVMLWMPYFLPMSRSVGRDYFEDQWSKGVCIQSNSSTCGPACAATLLKSAGIAATEKEIAIAAFTHAQGTETWYLARAMRKRGVTAEIYVDRRIPDNMRFPSIAAVRLMGTKGAKHFIVLFGKKDEGYIVGDPNEGRMTLTSEELRERYVFSGCYIHMTRKDV